MTQLRGRLHEWNAAIDATGDIRALSVLRIMLGPIVLLHLETTYRLAADGIVYSDRFYLPYASWYPEAGPTLYEVMLWTSMVAAVAMSVGVLTRLATTYTAFFVAYNVFLSKTHFSHNRAFLLILLIVVAIVPVGRHYSFDSWFARRIRGTSPPAEAPLWPLWLGRFEVVVVYCASATSKIIDQDWWSGLVMQRRAIDNRDTAIADGAPAWLMELLADDTMQSLFSKAAVMTEYVIGLGFVFRRTRLIAIWVAIPFHLAIEIGADVQVFSWAALAALVIWVTPRVRERRLTVPPGHWLSGVVRPLDWFGRFSIDETTDRGIEKPVVVDSTVEGPDGEATERHGADAFATTFSRMPVTFWFAAPVLAVARLRRRWAGRAQGS